MLRTIRFNAPAALLVAMVSAAFAPAAPAEETPAPSTYGWRGNWTGLYPDATPVTEWSREPKGPIWGLTCQAAKPADGAPKSGRPHDKGLIVDWLVLGPLPVADAVKEFDKEHVPDEATLSPNTDDKVGELAWTRLEINRKITFGPTELEWANLGGDTKLKKNRIAYAHSYLYCERAGKLAAVVDHVCGLKIRVNGAVVYNKPQTVSALGAYTRISNCKKELVNPHSGMFEFEVKQGWNRVLAKSNSDNRDGWNALQFSLRLADAEPVSYEEKNIVWATPLPERTNACPLVVGDKVFTVAEPDELLCLDKKTGKILWRRINGFFEATPEEERKASPVFAQIAPLAAELEQTYDYEKGLELRRKVRDLLNGVDKAKYDIKWDGHLAGHFGIVGFSTTPCSDGKNVYVFVGNGVAACYDLDGKRKWITRVPADLVAYSSSPALIAGKLVTNLGTIRAYDAETGKLVWEQPKAVGGVASLIAARVKGVDVVFTQKEDVVRASDGALLRNNPRKIPNDTGWSPPVVIGDVMYHAWGGFGLNVDDYSGVEGDQWKPKMQGIDGIVVNKLPNGEWLDKWTATSPLVHNGIAYLVDMYGTLYAVDVKAKKLCYRKDLDFQPICHYNAIPVAACPALGGKNVYVMDNQGTCIVFESGPEFKQVAKNHIGTLIPRVWPVPPQENISYGAPIFDGKYMYVRGEAHLYCIGEK
ncbi:MAG: PQQ-binding-like beta-propeller repeat protein [Planctomycetota bacterium]|nr:PQQ-binding-like beta-propeller repeat protein [Planctomycetota bacterium]